MGNWLSRRAFIGGAAAGAGSLIIGFDPWARSWILEGQGRPGGLVDLPPLDGVLASDDLSRQAFAIDHGNYTRRLPQAVLRPGSVDDVVRMVRYANRHGLPIAMRGQGHSRSGETLVEAGIVIDSRTLSGVEPAGANSVRGEAGVLLGEIYQWALPRGLTLPATPTCMGLSLGGVLSVGGWGGTSHRFGAMVDRVEQLEVVTGEGQIVTCSPGRQSELFEMVLAGLGQCGLIVAAQLELVPAPARVVRWGLAYDNLPDFISAQERVALDGRFHHLAGRATRGEDGNWTFRMEVGTFDSGEAEPDFAALEAGLKARSRSQPVYLSYRDYVGPENARAIDWAAARQTRQLGDLVMFIPREAAHDLTAEMLDMLSNSPYGPSSLTLVPLNLARFRRPLFKMPAGELAFSLWMFPRTVPTGETPAHRAMMAETRSLFGRMSAMGGKCYLAHSALPLSPAGWENHFGAKTWRRLGQAKRKYDPQRVLTPGPGIFPPRGEQIRRPGSPG